MDKIKISNRLTESILDLERVINTLQALQVTDIQKYPENYKTLSYDAALKMEGITCKLRNLVINTSSAKKSDYLLDAAHIQDISIKNENGVVSIILPALLPKKKQEQGKFLLDPLYAKLSEFSSSGNGVKFVECVVFIVYVYSYETPLRKIRDYDNIEAKQVIDAVSTFLLKDDSGFYVDVHNTTEFGKSNSTEIHLIEKSAFPKWLKERFSRVKTMSNF